MSRFRVAPACLRSVVAAALCAAPLLAAEPAPDKVKAAMDALKTVLDSIEGNVTGQYEQVMNLRVAEVEAILELPEERVRGAARAPGESDRGGPRRVEAARRKIAQDGGALG